MRKTAWIYLLVIALAARADEPRTSAELSRHGPTGVAIDGYSPVSYFTRGRAEKGSAEFAVEYDGLTYWLTDAEQAGEFAANPARFAPAHRGWCSLMLTGSGNLAVANPESFKIVDDRLLLFWSGDFKGQAIDGLRNWHSKFTDEAGERALLGKADKAWAKLLAGSMAEQVVFFSDADLGRVNDERRSTGRKMY